MAPFLYLVAQILRCRRRPTEPWLDWHRRQLRLSRWALWAWTGGDALSSALRQRHTWAGHLARIELPELRRARDWRDAAWYQLLPARRLRPGRPCLRWDESLVAHYGPVWTACAQDREAWRLGENRYVLTEWRRLSGIRGQEALMELVSSCLPLRDFGGLGREGADPGGAGAGWAE